MEKGGERKRKAGRGALADSFASGVAEGNLAAKGESARRTVRLEAVLQGLSSLTGKWLLPQN